MTTDLPLAGRTLVVTRARAQAGALSHLLSEQGAQVIEIPTIATMPLEDYGPLDRALKQLASYDWLLVTSANTARILGDRLSLMAAPGWPKRVAAVGRATADALRRIGLAVDLVPEPYIAESLIAALAHQVAGKRVLLARAAVARDALPEALCAAGANLDIADAYRTTIPEESQTLLAELMRSERVDGVTFTSSSTVTHLLELLDAGGFERPCRWLAFSIGPITSATLRGHGWTPAAEATEHDIPGLVAAVLAVLGR